MSTAAIARPGSRTSTWVARGLSTLVVAFLLFDAIVHLTVPAPVAQAFAELGVPIHLSFGIGLIELACTVLFVVPRTSVLGALLLTAYLGGATAIQVRAEAATFPVVFPAIVGTLLWAGLVIRHDRLRAFMFDRR